MSDKPEKLSLSTKPSKVVRLNRKAIITLVAVGLLVAVLAILMAFSGESKQSSHEGGLGFKVEQTIGSDTDASLNSLPVSYKQANKINALLNRDQQQVRYTTSPKVEQQMRLLKNQLSQMRSQLIQLQARGIQHQKTMSPIDKEAISSAIFFSGGAPRPAAKKTAKKEDGQDDQKKKDDHGNPYLRPSSYDEQNMQGEKLDFLTSKPSKDIYNSNTVQYPASKYILQAGTMIPATLQTQIVSNLPGMITAVVSQNVYDSIDGHFLLIPKGSKLIGVYNSKISFGQSELQAKFTRLIRPDGTSVVLPDKTGGVNQQGVSGFEDEVDNHWGRILGSAALATVFNIPAVVATSNSSNYGAYNPSTGTYTPASFGNQATSGVYQSLGQSASQVGNKITERSLNIQPTIIIHAGYRFSVLVNKDVILPPYHSAFHPGGH